MKIEPVTLQGICVRLEPLSLEHLDQFCEVGLEPQLWRWTTTIVSTREDMISYVQTALREQTAGTSLPFATILNETNRVVGCTRFANNDLDYRRVEIGWTWVGIPWQRTAVNTEAKYL
ncbi:MAG: GNAT family N-acetyltransferase, partial [Pyrinomonadaceae bacterium]